MGRSVDGGEAILVTRGNLDGIACAAVFLDHNPEGDVVFVTSPPRAAEAAARHEGPVIIADVPLNDEISDLLCEARGRIALVDHHPTSLRSEYATVDLSRSAAGILHTFLGGSVRSAKAAVLADHHERSPSPLLASYIERCGEERIVNESIILDMAWRSNVEDDRFRLSAARLLSEGSWPSETPIIAERSRAVLQSGRWAKALGLISGEMVVRGKVGLLDLRGRRLSLHGFGSVALSKVALARGCDYSVLLHSSMGNVTASLRSMASGSLELGSFVKRFTAVHGVDGGGHVRSAGARVPDHKADLLVEQLVAAI